MEKEREWQVPSDRDQAAGDGVVVVGGGDRLILLVGVGRSADPARPARGGGGGVENLALPRQGHSAQTCAAAIRTWPY